MSQQTGVLEALIIALAANTAAVEALTAAQGGAAPAGDAGKTTTTSKTTKTTKAAPTEIIPEVVTTRDRNGSGADSNMIPMPAMGILSKSTSGKQSQAHHQAKNERCRKLAHFGHRVVLSF